MTETHKHGRTQMNDKISQKAQQVYNATRPNDNYVKMMGVASLTPVQRASLEEIENHLRLVDEISKEYKLIIQPDKVAFGASRDEIVAIAESKVKRHKRRAGVRALEAKYGHDAAARIVKKHSGRTIQG